MTNEVLRHNFAYLLTNDDFYSFVLSTTNCDPRELRYIFRGTQLVGIYHVDVNMRDLIEDYRFNSEDFY